MKAKKILKETTSRSVYNRVRKVYLERKGEINCSFCPYHGGENRTNKYYGNYKIFSLNNKNDNNYYDKDVRYPSWKLASRNRKQWMCKNLKFVNVKTNSKFYNDYYLDITW